MNQEEALIHLREIAKRSPEVTACPRLAELKKHQAAFKVVDKLIAQRTAKRMWREAGKGGQPITPNTRITLSTPPETADEPRRNRQPLRNARA